MWGLRLTLVGACFAVACDLENTLITDPDLLGTIEGQVTVTGVGGVGGITVTLTGLYTDSTTTDGSGGYVFQRVAGGSYTVTISDTPPGVSFVQLQQSAVVSSSDPVMLDFQGSYSPVQIPTTSLSSGQVGVAYSDSVQATGGPGTYTWSVLTGTLPAGLTLISGTGQISGTPTVAGTETFIVQAATPTDTVARQLSILVVAPGLQVTTTALPSAEIGVAYGETLQTTGGSGAQTWSVIAGALPTGLGLAASTGVLGGVPTSVGVSNFTVRVATPTDTATADLSLTVSTASGILHRWRFSEIGGGGTTLVDDVGGADATLVDVGPNDGAATGGLVLLAGGDHATTDYVALPSGLLSGLTDATIELWASQIGVERWGRIFDFGNGANDYLMMSWSIDVDALRDQVEWRALTSQDFAENTMAPYALSTEYHIAMTVDDDGGTGSNTLVTWYLDGVEAGSFETARDLSELGDVNNWLGRSQSSSDSTANAVYNELRIYSRALTASDVLANTGNPPPAAVLQPTDSCSDFPSSALVSFADGNLEGAVRSALGLGPSDPLTCAIASTLATLTADVSGIADLNGIQNLTGATFLDLRGNSISDVSPLGTLTNLTELRLDTNLISAIGPLGGLSSLSTLWIAENSITDIGALVGLTNLTYLHMFENSVVDFTALGGLTGLTFLDMRNNSGTDISALSTLTSLSQLRLDGIAISDLSPISGLTGLTDLWLTDTSLSDVTALSGLTGLSVLTLADNSITDISALASLTAMTTLGLDGNAGLSDVQALIDNTGLGAGDTVDLRYTSVACAADAALAAKGVGVTTLATFADANLEGAVRSGLGLGPSDELTCGSARTLTSLTALSLGITDVSGVEALTGLDTLVLGINSISDVSDVAGLTNLKYLELGVNQITDLTPVAGLTNLTQLGVHQNPTTDISAVSGLTSLTNLNIFAMGVSDLTPLSGLANLSVLEATSNQISDLTPLSGLGALTFLNFNGNLISDAGPLSGLSNLSFINLSANLVTDISPLLGLTNLITVALENLPGLSDIQALVNNPGLGAGDNVELRNTGVTCVSDAALAAKGVAVTTLASFTDANLEGAVRSALGLSGPDELTCTLARTLTSLTAINAGITSVEGAQALTGLTTLTITENSITDVSPLGGLTGLTTLHLFQNNISDIGPLGTLTNLTTLELGRNSISSIAAVSGLTGLTFLGIGENPGIADYGPVTGLTGLTNLGLGSNNIADISFLSGLTGLTTLGLFGNPLSDISPLGGLTNLVEVHLGETGTSDVSVLSSLTNLERLYLGDPSTSITDLTPLGGLTGLTLLYLDRTSLSDLTPLGSLTNLQTLALADTDIVDITALQGLTSLTSVFLNLNAGLSDIQPLLSNVGLGAGDSVDLTSTGVSCGDVSALRATGATVVSTCP